MTLDDLYIIISNRIKKRPKDSYIVSLIDQGEDAILQKIGEEATEVIIAAKGKKKQRIVEEAADLYFMTLILMAFKKIHLNKILEELEKRHK